MKRTLATIIVRKPKVRTPRKRHVNEMPFDEYSELGKLGWVLKGAYMYPPGQFPETTSELIRPKRRKRRRFFQTVMRKKQKLKKRWPDRLAKENGSRTSVQKRRIVEDLGHEIATPNEARKILALKSADRVGF